MRRRIRAVQTVSAGALSRAAAALDADERAKARARRLIDDPSFAVFETGGPATRAAVATLRKRLIALQLDERLDHRSGRYRRAATAARRAVRDILK